MYELLYSREGKDTTFIIILPCTYILVPWVRITYCRRRGVGQTHTFIIIQTLCFPLDCRNVRSSRKVKRKHIDTHCLTQKCALLALHCSIGRNKSLSMIIKNGKGCGSFFESQKKKPCIILCLATTNFNFLRYSFFIFQLFLWGARLKNSQTGRCQTSFLLFWSSSLLDQVSQNFNNKFKVDPTSFSSLGSKSQAQELKLPCSSGLPHCWTRYPKIQ